MNRLCSRCTISKDELEFYESRGWRNGQSWWCKECIRKYSREQYGARREKIYTYQQSVRGRYARFKTASKKRDLTFLLSLEQFTSIVAAPCHYCGEDRKQRNLDRIDNKLGYVLDNVASCCGMCNMMKRNYTMSEFLEQCEKVVGYNMASGKLESK